MEEWVRFEDVKVKRDGYYVRYAPKTIGFPQETALASVTILGQLSPEECKSIAENEYDYWINRYPIPLQVNIRYQLPDVTTVSKLTGSPYICGVSSSIYRWGSFVENEVSEYMPSDNEIHKIYEGLNNVTSEENNSKLKNEFIVNKIVYVMIIGWAVVIPAIIAFAGWANPYVSALALLYSWYKCYGKWRELTKRKSQDELDKDEENLRREHHHYHCSLNPEAFNKLRHENFKKSGEAKLKNELKNMKAETL